MKVEKCQYCGARLDNDWNNQICEDCADLIQTRMERPEWPDLKKETPNKDKFIEKYTNGI